MFWSGRAATLSEDNRDTGRFLDTHLMPIYNPKPLLIFSSSHNAITAQFPARFQLKERRETEEQSNLRWAQISSAYRNTFGLKLKIFLHPYCTLNTFKGF